MPSLPSLLSMAVIAAPLLLMLALGLRSLVDRPLSERVTSGLTASAIVSGLLAALGLLAVNGASHFTLVVGNWVVIPDYHFSVKFLFDLQSLPFVVLTYVLCGTIAAFATRYLHREPGFHRFFLLLALFLAGMILTALAGTIEVLFSGWELVGLSSALLVAFFHERIAPVRNGLRVWVAYRVSDAALLIAAVVLHHMRGEGDFEKLLGLKNALDGHAVLSAQQALIVGLLLLLAAAGKSALVPFSGWLPRAMEGPTPSSAVFYGALSVHLGAYLLLRVSPIIELSLPLSVAVVGLGLITALFSALAGRVQTDIKCALTFASLTQVSIIVVEIGLGLRYIALAHMLGHACLRTLQFLRAPTLLQDYRLMENAVGARLPRLPGPWERFLPAGQREWFYRLGMERGYLDAWLDDYIARPVVAFFRFCDSLERKWTDFLSGGSIDESAAAGPSDRALTSSAPLDDLL